MFAAYVTSVLGVIHYFSKEGQSLIDFKMEIMGLHKHQKDISININRVYSPGFAAG